jgi:hypothetical protein
MCITLNPWKLKETPHKYDWQVDDTQRFKSGQNKVDKLWNMLRLHKLEMFKHIIECKLGLMHCAFCIIMNATYTIWKGWKLGIVMDCFNIQRWTKMLRNVCSHNDINGTWGIGILIWFQAPTSKFQCKL